MDIVDDFFRSGAEGGRIWRGRWNEMRESPNTIRRGARALILANNEAELFSLVNELKIETRVVKHGRFETLAFSETAPQAMNDNFSFLRSSFFITDMNRTICRMWQAGTHWII